MKNFIRILLATVLVSFCYTKTAPQDATLLLNRIWFNKLPENQNDSINFYYFSDVRMKNGEFWFCYRSGPWTKYEFWNGTFTVQTPEVTIRWPHNQSVSKTTFKVTQGEFGEFQLKLEFNDPRNGGNPTVLYGFLDEGCNQNLKKQLGCL